MRFVPPAPPPAVTAFLATLVMYWAHRLLKLHHHRHCSSDLIRVVLFSQSTMCAHTSSILRLVEPRFLPLFLPSDERAQKDTEIKRDCAEIKQDGANGAEIKQDGANGAEIKQDGANGAEIKQDGANGAEIKQDGANGAEIKQDCANGAEIKQDCANGAEIKQDCANGADFKQDGANGAEIKQDCAEDGAGAEIKQDCANGAEIKQDGAVKEEAIITVTTDTGGVTLRCTDNQFMATSEAQRTLSRLIRLQDKYCANNGRELSLDSIPIRGKEACQFWNSAKTKRIPTEVRDVIIKRFLQFPSHKSDEHEHIVNFKPILKATKLRVADSDKREVQYADGTPPTSILDIIQCNTEALRDAVRKAKEERSLGHSDDAAAGSEQTPPGAPLKRRANEKTSPIRRMPSLLDNDLIDTWDAEEIAWSKLLLKFETSGVCPSFEGRRQFTFESDDDGPCVEPELQSWIDCDKALTKVLGSCSEPCRRLAKRLKRYQSLMADKVLPACCSTKVLKLGIPKLFSGMNEGSVVGGPSSAKGLRRPAARRTPSSPFGNAPLSLGNDLVFYRFIKRISRVNLVKTNFDNFGTAPSGLLLERDVPAVARPVHGVGGALAGPHHVQQSVGHLVSDGAPDARLENLVRRVGGVAVGGGDPVPRVPVAVSGQAGLARLAVGRKVTLGVQHEDLLGIRRVTVHARRDLVVAVVLAARVVLHRLQEAGHRAIAAKPAVRVLDIAADCALRRVKRCRHRRSAGSRARTRELLPVRREPAVAARGRVAAGRQGWLRWSRRRRWRRWRCCQLGVCCCQLGVCICQLGVRIIQEGLVSALETLNVGLVVLGHRREFTLDQCQGRRRLLQACSDFREAGCRLRAGDRQGLVERLEVSGRRGRIDADHATGQAADVLGRQGKQRRRRQSVERIRPVIGRIVWLHGAVDGVVRGEEAVAVADEDAHRIRGRAQWMRSDPGGREGDAGQRASVLVDDELPELVQLVRKEGLLLRTQRQRFEKMHGDHDNNDQEPHDAPPHAHHSN
ncbi:hypothetical protein CEUSTIGMA_g13134.t1 [Chlamydomonas eustigma]|uniref:Uncharacterized protein n=1 Tax=Chlamydomonas eustigma TaxID=1157962 RepID=A0A250XS00_9CHLO|nr:hypothetical protein CEUSTIGMA_g13134.t1 [Chlamydomonas eustigma]|eukprot:GAX85719.1 hypothetical protein CEUSTIGMA_g13134.t1 [Chlamydomonas eustigma]